MKRLKGIIVDADFCIKIGASPKYRYLERILKEFACRIYIHKNVYDEIIIPVCAKEQIDSLIEQGIVEVITEDNLKSTEKMIYQYSYKSLATVMSNPNNPRKNRGEISSLAMAKTKSISYFATDERDLQPIIDKVLNTGLDDITCIRIEDVIKMIRIGQIEGFKRKEAKVLWRLAGKRSDIFDKDIWPI